MRATSASRSWRSSPRRSIGSSRPTMPAARARPPRACPTTSTRSSARSRSIRRGSSPADRSRDGGAATRASTTGCRSARWRSSRGARASKARTAGPSASSTARSSVCSSSIATASPRSARTSPTSTATSRTRASRPCPEFKRLLYQHACEGMYGDPVYGGNRDEVGWKMIGWLGDIQPAATPTSKCQKLENDPSHPWIGGYSPAIHPKFGGERWLISIAMPSSSGRGPAGRPSPTCSRPPDGR